MNGLKLSAVLLAGALALSVEAAAGPLKQVITIQSIQLKNSSGEWTTIIEPDRQVDLAAEQTAVSFLNNGRRVPPGKYGNFKIIFSEKNEAGEIQLYGKEDFSIEVKARSFISVWFQLNLSDTLRRSTVKEATVTVDDQTFTIPGASMNMVFQK